MIKLINISVRRTVLESFSFKSDTVGAFASGLCMIHCLATPFFLLPPLAQLAVVTTPLFGGSRWIIYF